MDKMEKIIFALVICGMAILLSGGLFFVYYFDKASCYDKTANYKAQLQSYSWIKNYCFVKMPNSSIVNLENYRDIKELNK
jgi:hypothetical protein|tara:strand:- start:865 stop:1104 length:240 start_codon:yes stop_codon:yes gene_type:complete